MFLGQIRQQSISIGNKLSSANIYKNKESPTHKNLSGIPNLVFSLNYFNLYKIYNLVTNRIIDIPSTVQITVVHIITGLNPIYFNQRL